jgi:hypothetical protein
MLISVKEILSMDTAQGFCYRKRAMRSSASYRERATYKIDVLQRILLAGKIDAQQHI